jgi:hypothetical protein
LSLLKLAQEGHTADVFLGEKIILATSKKIYIFLKFDNLTSSSFFYEIDAFFKLVLIV